MKERKRQTEMSVEGRKDVCEYVWREKREREGEREGRSDGGTGRTEVSLFFYVCVFSEETPTCGIRIGRT